MRSFRMWMVVFLSLAATLAAVGQNVPLPVPAPAKLAVPNVFSYQPPPGWVVTRLNGLPYPIAMEKKGEDAGLGFTPAMITVNVDLASLPLPEWCNKSLAMNKAQFAALNAQVGELATFTTATPTVVGFRAPIDLTAKDRKLHYVMYFFNGNGDAKLAVTCACSAQDAARYAPIFDAAMKSFYPY